MLMMKTGLQRGVLGRLYSLQLRCHLSDATIRLAHHQSDLEATLSAQAAVPYADRDDIRELSRRISLGVFESEDANGCASPFQV